MTASFTCLECRFGKHVHRLLILHTSHTIALMISKMMIGGLVKLKYIALTLSVLIRGKVMRLSIVTACMSILICAAANASDKKEVESLNGKTTVQNNQGTWAGGLLIGIMQAQTTVNLNDQAKVYNNQSSHYTGAAGALVMNGKIIMNDASSITQNQTTTGVGGVRVHFIGYFEMNDDSAVSYNTGVRGGGILAGYTFLKLSDRAAITYNTSPLGSAIVNYGDGKVWIRSNEVRIAHNTTTNNGTMAVHFQREQDRDGELFLDEGVTASTVIQQNTRTPSGATANNCTPSLQEEPGSIVDIDGSTVHTGPYYTLVCAE